MTISRLYIKEVATVYRDENIREAISVMKEYGVSAIVVVDCISNLIRPVGVLTEHDIVTRALMTGSSPDRLLVHQVMTHNPICCKPNSGVYETIQLMQRNSIKRLPVIDESGELIGLITSTDLVMMLGDEINRLTYRPGRITGPMMGSL
jgi:CBS domain-containing protein